VATLASILDSANAMAAASKGVEMKSMNVVDFLPADSMKWKKRTRLSSGGIKHPVAQAHILKRAFGFQ
jgi:hypothetical protein